MNPTGKHRPKRRHPGEGSVLRRTDRWRAKPWAAVVPYTDASGRRRETWLSAASREEAEGLRKRELARLAKRTVPTEHTVGSYVRDCVRPDHLFLGTAQENVADMIAKSRRGDIRPPIRRGENHYAARLTDGAVAEIRAAVAAGDPHRSIADRHSISRQYVGMLARGEKRV